MNDKDNPKRDEITTQTGDVFFEAEPAAKQTTDSNADKSYNGQSHSQISHTTEHSIAQEQEKITVNQSKRDVSKNGLNLSLFLVSSNIASILIVVIALAAFEFFSSVAPKMGDSCSQLLDRINAITSSPDFLPFANGLLSIISMYVIAFPVFFIIQMNTMKRNYRKGGMKAYEFLIIIPIAHLIMQIGSDIGETLNLLLSSLLRLDIQNSAIESITKMPLCLMTVMACVFAPIVEEFMFRRTLIGTLGKYGNVFAIIISAVAFGLFHGNLYQFFYAFLVGLILGYVYVKSGNWWLCVLMHAIMNFLGGVLPETIDMCTAKYETLAELLNAGEKVNQFELIFLRSVNTAYVAAMLALFIAGLVLSVIAIAKKWYKIDNAPEVELPKKSVASVVLLNAGSIIFLAFSAITMAIAIFVT